MGKRHQTGHLGVNQMPSAGWRALMFRRVGRLAIFNPGGFPP
jgi:hypothetical protein